MKFLLSNMSEWPHTKLYNMGKQQEGYPTRKPVLVAPYRYEEKYLGRRYGMAAAFFI